MLSPKPVLLPFEQRDRSAMKVYIYWNTILPGSKRYLGESGMVGDNTDVRPPADDERWQGGIIAGGGSGGGSSRDPIRQVTLMLDCVCFLDGEFVGPDSGKIFEQTLADAEARRMVAKIAKSGHDAGMSPSEILTEIKKTTGIAPDTPPMPATFRNAVMTQEDFRAAALQSIAYQLGTRRRFTESVNEEQTVLMIMSWNDVVLPSFRRA